MENLLPYYERELTYLRRLSHDFAKRYPKIAGRLLLSGEACDDPHIERLIESFAFLAGRIHKKLDDDFPEITDALLQVMYPQFLRPYPSVSIAQFDGGNAAGQLSKPVRVARHTMLHSSPVRGVRCRFRTVYDVDIVPVQITHVSYETAVDLTSLPGHQAQKISSTIRIDLNTLSDAIGFEELSSNKLRFFINGEPSVVAAIREALFCRAIVLWVKVSNSENKILLPCDAIQAVGFGGNETLLEQEVHCHHAYQLLLEYFVFPEKFNFFELDLQALKGKLPPRAHRIEIRIGLSLAQGETAANHLLDRIGSDQFVLGCTPIINLFDQPAEPIRVTDTLTSYPIIVDSRKPYAYEVFDIRRVFKICQSINDEEIEEFSRFFSIRHAEPHDGPKQYWHVSYGAEDTENGAGMEITLVDSNLCLQRPQTNSLSLELSCTNRDLPAQLPFGLVEGDLFMEGGTAAKIIRMLRKPSQSYRFPRGRGAQWRLVSHLSLNHLSLSGTGVDAIKEILTIYDISKSPVNARQINGIVAIESRTVTARIAGNPFPTFARGLEIRLTVNEDHYAGVGLFIFAQVLDRFFGLYVHTNSFTQLVVISQKSGQELIKCAPRNGESILA